IVGAPACEQLRKRRPGRGRRTHSDSKSMSRRLRPERTQHSPNTRPVLPLRGVVLLPGTAKAARAAHPVSVAAVREALAGDGTLCAAAQRDIAAEEPPPDALFRVGALARIPRHEWRDDGTISVELESLRRAEAESILERDHSWSAALRFEPRSGSRRGRV